MSTPDTALILLSPRSRRRNTLLAQFVMGKDGVGFYALTPQDSTLHTFLHDLQESMRETYPSLGHEMARTLARGRAQVQDLTRACLADLAQVRPALHYLLLDQFDYLTLDQDVHRFLQHVGDNSLLHVVINSRQLTWTFWSPFFTRGQAQVVGDEVAPDEQPTIEFFGFSHGTVLARGVPVTVWTGPLVRNLFFYLADHPLATRDEIFEIFWPDLSIKEATNVFHVTKRKITECLGQELTAYADGFYRHAPAATLRYDVATFDALVQKAAELAPAEALPLWEQAVHLYRLPFLCGLDMPWVVRRRDQLKADYAEALLGIGRIMRARGDSRAAVPFFRRAAREFPAREDLCRDLMELLRDQGQLQQAVDQYMALANRLERSLGIQPSPVTRRLYERLTGKASARQSKT